MGLILFIDLCFGYTRGFLWDYWIYGEWGWKTTHSWLHFLCLRYLRFKENMTFLQDLDWWWWVESLTFKFSISFLQISKSILWLTSDNYQVLRLYAFSSWPSLLFAYGKYDSWNSVQIFLLIKLSKVPKQNLWLIHSNYNTLDCLFTLLFTCPLLQLVIFTLLFAHIL